MSRAYSAIDRALMGMDRGLKTLIPGSASPQRETPANRSVRSPDYSRDEQRHIAGLMRINHTGEVCAQALYQGQALTAKNANIKQAMEVSAQEEVDHLAWCEQRLKDLNSHTSHLNPLFYAASFAIGASAGLISDRVSLGFVAATEDQVCLHLKAHLQELPDSDEQSRAVLNEMLIDEAEHANSAIAAGGIVFPQPVKNLMTLASKLMTKTTYHI